MTCGFFTSGDRRVLEAAFHAFMFRSCRIPGIFPPVVLPVLQQNRKNALGCLAGVMFAKRHDRTKLVAVFEAKREKIRSEGGIADIRSGLSAERMIPLDVLDKTRDQSFFDSRPIRQGSSSLLERALSMLARIADRHEFEFGLFLLPIHPKAHRGIALSGRWGCDPANHVEPHEISQNPMQPVDQARFWQSPESAHKQVP